ncbi:MAG TPA: hypothetical protein VFB99_07485, partial [Vicinamibacterales bacterium]|nr:hypothetical protein [Vicinamibacterales bacterium]
MLFSGFSRKKRVYQLWALNPETLEVRLRATGTPQLTDAVYVGTEDAAAAVLPGGDGGLLAATAKAVMYFPEPADGWMSNAAALDNPAPLRDATSLGLKGSTQLLSVDLVRSTQVLMLATSDRKLLVTAGGAATPFVPALPKPATCTVKTQRLLVRNARGGSDAASVVSDLCGQVLRYDFTTTSTSVSAPYDMEVTTSAGLVAIAVGEGNVVTCEAGEPCTLANGFEAELQTKEDLLVRQYANLCDPRVDGCNATGTVYANNALILNSLLPQAVQDALEFNPLIDTDDVIITVPPYMFAAGPNGRFGVLIVQGDDAAAAGQATVELEIDELLGFELGTRSTGNSEYPPFVRGAADTTTLNLLNQDIVAYAPDNPLLPTVANYPTPGGMGFEATPVTTGSYNPLVGGLRGFSVVIYGLQHDLNSPDRPRGVNGGLPSLEPGNQRLCNLSAGSQQYIAIDSPERFFANLAACLLVDQKALVSNVIPGFVLAPPDRSSLLSRLANVEDKLIKALNATGPNSGSEAFEAVLSQVENYDAQVLGTTFISYAVYKNELVVRSQAFRFNLMERTYP